MLKRKFFKYDIILSFTEEDSEIARRMKKSLKKKGLSVYYYKDKNQLAEDLNELTPYLYGERANYGLVILSEAYKRKQWPRKEWEAMKWANHKGNMKGIFVVRVQKTTLPGLSRSIIQAKWNDNPEEIAGRIKGQMKYPGNRLLKSIGWLLILILIAAGIYHFQFR